MQVTDGSHSAHLGRRQGIGIPHPGEGQAAVVCVDGFSVGSALVEQVGRNKPLIVDDLFILEAVRKPKGAAILVGAYCVRLLIAVCPFGAVFVQEQFVKPVPGHTGAAVVVAEGQHIAIGPPGPLPIPAGPVVGRRVDAVSPGKIAASAVLPAGDIIVIEVGGEFLPGLLGVIHQTDHGAILDVDHVVPRHALPVGEVDAAGIVINLPAI